MSFICSSACSACCSDGWSGFPRARPLRDYSRSLSAGRSHLHPEIHEILIDAHAAQDNARNDVAVKIRAGVSLVLSIRSWPMRQSSPPTRNALRYSIWSPSFVRDRNCVADGGDGLALPRGNRRQQRARRAEQQAVDLFFHGAAAAGIRRAPTRRTRSRSRPREHPAA